MNARPFPATMKRHAPNILDESAETYVTFSSEPATKERTRQRHKASRNDVTHRHTHSTNRDKNGTFKCARQSKNRKKKRKHIVTTAVLYYIRNRWSNVTCKKWQLETNVCMHTGCECACVCSTIPCADVPALRLIEFLQCALHLIAIMACILGIMTHARSLSAEWLYHHQCSTTTIAAAAIGLKSMERNALGAKV